MILEFQNLTADYFRGGPTCVESIARGRPLALACGCFDVLTVGHVRHLQAARKNGCLAVLVTADEHVNKGPGRPVFSQELRAEVVNALRCVDYVVINPYPTAVEAIRVLRPQVYVKGREYERFADHRIREEDAAVRGVGGRMEFTDTEELHTTDVLERLMGTNVSTDLVDKGMRGRTSRPCKGWIGRSGDLKNEPCNLCGWPAEAHSCV